MRTKREADKEKGRRKIGSFTDSAVNTLCEIALSIF